MTALAASIGTGNIAGVATAIISGGPGALFWIWVYGFVATSIKFSEAVLGVKFRQINGAHVQSGPMYYLRDGLKSPGARLDLRARRRRRGADDDAVHAAEFDRDCGRPRHSERAGRAAAHRRGQQTGLITGLVVAVLTWAVIIGGITVDRPRGGEARAAQGRPLSRRRAHRHHHVRGPAAARVLAGVHARR